MPTADYPHEHFLRKIYIGGKTYYFKDEDLRNLVENFGTAVYKDAVDNMTVNGTNIPTEKGISNYFDQTVRPIIHQKASVELGFDEELVMHFYPSTEILIIVKWYQPEGMTVEEYLEYLQVEVDNNIPQLFHVPIGTDIGQLKLNIWWRRTSDNPTIKDVYSHLTTDETGNCFDNILDEHFVLTEDMTLYLVFNNDPDNYD